MSDVHTYLCRLGGKLALVTADLSLVGSSPDPNRPKLVYVASPLAQPDEDGLVGQDELEEIHEAEIGMTALLERAIGARWVGRIVTSGRFECYFYAPIAVGARDAVTEALSEIDELWELEVGVQDDPAWLHYLDVLVPEDPEAIAQPTGQVPEA